MIDLVLRNYHEGNLIEAENLCRDIIRNEPDNADALHVLGLIYFRRADPDTALSYISKALEINPLFADALNDIGVILQEMGRLDEAIDNYQKALRIRPDLIKTSYSLANAFQAKGDIDGALAGYRRVIQLDPNFPAAYYNLGLILQTKGELDEAIFFYLKTIELAPDFEAAYYVLGGAFQGKGEIEEAMKLYQKSIELNPSCAEAYNNLGVIFQGKGELEKALSCYKKAIQANPEFEQAFNNLGNAYKDLGEWEKARKSYARAIEINPGYVLAHYNLGNTNSYLGLKDEAIAAYDKALEHGPDFLTAQWAKCMAQLPIIYPDEASILIFRERYSNELVKLRGRVSLKTPKDIAIAAEAVGSHQPFFLAYQGYNDRDLQRLYGELVCGIMAKRYPQFSENIYSNPVRPGEPLRVGIVSAFFYRHSNWKIPIKGWVENIDKKNFHLYGYHTGKTRDEETIAAGACFNRFVEGCFSLEKMCEIIRNDNLYVLLYPEIGMDPLTLQLAALRLSPIQCASWGHPETSGLPTIDYFLSSDLMEPSDADTHYTEKLVRLPNLSIYYTPLDIHEISMDRDTFNIRQKSTLYLCSQSLFKYLPQYDEIYPHIVRNVGDCLFLFISEINTALTEQFQSRIQKAFNKFGLVADEYVIFLPRLDQRQYHAINRLSDIYLDSIDWSGCNSTFEAVACDLPIVTMPGKFMRGRHSAAILAMMGLTETIASSVDDYIGLAVRLGSDADWRREISEKTALNKHRIYRDKACIAALENFLEKTIRERSMNL